jgi:DNA-binding NtrC family response regulator
MIAQLLIADGDTLVLDRCRGYFTRHGYQVEVAADGLQCLDSLYRMPPNILVLDQELLWGGGDGVLAYLREDQWRWPKTVVVTTSQCADGAPLAIDPPVKAVLEKPFSLARLGEAIRRAHFGRRIWRHAFSGRLNKSRHWNSTDVNGANLMMLPMNRDFPVSDEGP